MSISIGLENLFKFMETNRIFGPCERIPTVRDTDIYTHEDQDTRYCQKESRKSTRKHIGDTSAIVSIHTSPQSVRSCSTFDLHNQKGVEQTGETDFGVGDSPLKATPKAMPSIMQTIPLPEESMSSVLVYLYMKELLEWRTVASSTKSM